MPRPARAFGENAFNIIGEKLMGANGKPKKLFELSPNRAKILSKWCD